MRLSKMFKNAPTINITGLCSDSRKVRAGDIYFCLPGFRYDGHKFARNAVENGAVCVVYSQDLDDMIEGAVYIKVDDVATAMNQCARLFYSKPSDKMTMYGITGTNGKSTIANIIRYIREIQEPCGYIGTISIDYGNVHLPPNLTTPDTIFLQEKLADMVRCGMKSCALEVSSHGLAQHRVDGIQFDVAIFTNLTHDHLDYHGTMDNYFEAKAMLFKSLVKPEGVSILNADDAKFEDLKEVSRAKVISYGIDNECDYRASDITIGSKSSTYTLTHGENKYTVHTNLVARYNVYNLLAAIAALHESGMDMETIIKACQTIPQVEGRMEQIECGQDFHVIVDFAHTPDGMEQMMQYGREIAGKSHRVIAVFGSAGKRDIAKRKVFGEIAEKYCDYIILTEDDPRDEDPADIAAQIREGITTKTNLFIAQRYEAIRQAIQNANAGDVVLLLGKGDEVFMYHENGRVPWKGDNISAKECIQEVLAEESENE